MRSVILTEAGGPAAERYPRFLEALLPERAVAAIARAVGEGIGSIEEIRLRRGLASSLTTDRGTVLLSVTLSGREMDETLTRVCGGSLYAHSETIGLGYVVLEEGVRVGVAGRAAVEGGSVIGVYDPTSLVFRIPGAPRVDPLPIERLLRHSIGESRGILIYAPPGEGKTTLLRALIRRLGGGAGAMRIAVVDSRGELALATSGGVRYTVELLSGYPRPLGIEIAVRTLRAELIVCDELGGVDEARAVLAVQNAGVPLLATAHGRSPSGLFLREGIRMLHEARIFSHYVGIARAAGGFSYTVTPWEDADAPL